MGELNYNNYIELIKQINDNSKTVQTACVVTYGCQQNVSDSEIISGMLEQMGYVLCDTPAESDVVVFNTCAVREHAELKVYGNIGALKPIKRKKPNMRIAVCGCMMQQQSVQQQIKQKYNHVNIVFGPSLIYKFPEMLFNSLSEGKKTFDRTENKTIFENLPIKRSENGKAWVTVMYGCNNFCTYCIVPYLRGRERSRQPQNIINEVKELVESGFKDITLLGQNVNSYGNDLEGDFDFADLLTELNKIEGDFWIRFMTSHPKDCSIKLLDTMAACEKVCNQLHLPFQAGNDRVLDVMNRRYTSEKYINLIDYAKKVMPDITLTSDVIVGFPGETFDEFLDTVELLKRVEFDNLFTFIYSRRSGTPAATMAEQIPDEEKSRRFNILLNELHPISKKKNDLLFGKTMKVFVEGYSKTDKTVLTGRTEGGKTVDFKGGDDLIGNFANVEIVESKTWSLIGKLI